MLLKITCSVVTNMVNLLLMSVTIMLLDIHSVDVGCGTGTQWRPEAVSNGEEVRIITFD